MAAGTVRTRLTSSLVTARATFQLPLDFAQSCDEVAGPLVIEVADATTDQSLIVLGAAGLTTIQALVVVSDAAISLKLGTAGSNVAFALAANAPFLLMGTSLTAVAVSNASGGVALVTYLVGGT
jgi:hypothetical protein